MVQTIPVVAFILSPSSEQATLNLGMSERAMLREGVTFDIATLISLTATLSNAALKSSVDLVMLTLRHDISQSLNDFYSSVNFYYLGSDAVRKMFVIHIRRDLAFKLSKPNRISFDKQIVVIVVNL